MVEGTGKRFEVESIIARLLDGAITDEELFNLLESMDVNKRFKLMKRVIGLVRQVHTLLDATRLIAKDVHDIDGCVEKITALACQNVGAEKANLRRLDQNSLLEGRGGYIEKKGGFESTTEEAVWHATWDDGKVFVDHVVQTKETWVLGEWETQRRDDLIETNATLSRATQRKLTPHPPQPPSSASESIASTQSMTRALHRR